MLEWLEVRLDVGTLNDDGSALKQECRLASIAGSGTQKKSQWENPNSKELFASKFRVRLLKEENCNHDDVVQLWEQFEYYQI